MGGEGAVVSGRAYGLNLSCRLPLRSRLSPSRGPVDLTIQAAVDVRPVSAGGASYESPIRGVTGESIVRVRLSEGADILTFPGVADFRVGARTVRGSPGRLAGEHMMEILLLSTVLVFWLERAGIAALHASAVAVDGRAVVFLSGKEAGKTTLACEFVRAGHALLADDILPLEAVRGEIRVRPSHPNLRLWPEAAGHLLGDWRDLPLVHPDFDKRRVAVGAPGFGVFDDRRRPPARIYLPDRSLGAGPLQRVEIHSVRPAEAAMELIRHSFAAPMVEGLGWQERRLGLFAELIRQAPVRRLVYPSGYDRLPAVRDAILEDLASTP